MASYVTFIDTRGAEIVAVRKVLGRAPAAPGRFVITDAAQLQLLTEQDHHLLKWSGVNVLPKTAGEVAAIETAEEATRDGQLFDDLSRRAVLAMLLDEINGLRAQHSLPARTMAQARQAYLAKLAELRNP